MHRFEEVKMDTAGEKHHMISHHVLHDLLHHHRHHHHHHHDHHGKGNKGEIKGIPKGCMVVMVGHETEEELQRFIIPIMYIHHPLFLQLLKEAEEEYGFDHKGPITIPCHVEEFRGVKDMIDHQHDDHHHHFLCFSA